MRMFHQASALPLAMLLFIALSTTTRDSAARAEPGNASSALSARSTQSAAPPVPEENPMRRLARLRAKLGQIDQIVAMRALHMALTRVPDGGTFIWQKKSLSLKGMIKPSKPFRNAEGQVCRHVVYALMLDRYTKQIEGIACRLDDGRWQL